MEHPRLIVRSRTWIRRQQLFGISSTGLSIGGLSVRWYGVAIALGIMLAVALAMRRERHYGLPRDTALDLALCGMPAAILGARLYYVIFSWDAYRGDPVRALYIWEGGLAIYGGILGGLLAGLAYARRRHLRFLTLCDLAAPCFALGQAIGRWGNFFNQEAYGIAATHAWQMRFPVSVWIGADGQWHLATFFYESAWCLLIVVFLLACERRARFRRPGDAFFTYGLLYGLERAVVEGLRTDSLWLGPVRVSQALSLAAAFACGVVLIARHRRGV